MDDEENYYGGDFDYDDTDIAEVYKFTEVDPLVGIATARRAIGQICFITLDTAC